MSDSARVLVVGSINTDLVVTVNVAPVAGETVTGSAFDIFGGGKGANQAVAAARSGSSVTMLGGVGRDEFGDGRLADLEAEHVDVGQIMRSESEPSGVALITVEATGENRIAYVPGATWSITPEIALQAAAASRPAWVLMTLELPLDTLTVLRAWCNEREIPVICNATPEPSAGKSLAVSCDVLIANETEAIELLERRDLSENWESAANDLRSLGPDTVVVTLGAHGAIVATEERTEVIPAPVVEVVDTTGAGDAFCGSFVSAMSRGLDPFEASRIAVVAGALAVTKTGAQPSIPSLDQISSAIASVT